MRLLITGSTGFIGQNLMPVLLSEFDNLEILTLNRSVEKARQMFSSADYPFVSHAGAGDWGCVRTFNPEVVFHLAALNTVANSGDVIDDLISSNITYGVHLLNVLSQCPALRLFVNTGSFAEYRLGTKQFNSAYLYSATKTAFRSFLDYYSDLKGFKYITAVLYTVYGGKPTIKRLMDYVIESLQTTRSVDMTAGEQVLDFIHVSDVVSFYVHILQHLDAYLSLDNKEEFHIGTGRGTTVRELAAIVEQVFGKKCNINWGGRPYRERDTMYAVAPIASNLIFTGWKSTIQLLDGVDKTCHTIILHE
ncbi:NAD-dependent epimerase/dehydratase family protein [Phocaeicola sp.]